MLKPAEQKRIERLRGWRTEEAARLGLEISVVLPQRLIDRLAEQAPRSLEELRQVEGLRAWRVETYGPVLLERLAV